MSLVCPSCDVVPDAGAAPGAPCAVCGARLIDDAAPSTDPLQLKELDLVDLGDRTGAPAPRKPEKAPVEQLHPDIVNLAPTEEKLELEGSWAKEKADKVAGVAAPSPLASRVMAENRAARRHNAGLTFALLLVLAVIGAGAFLYWKASKQSSDAPPTTPAKVPDRGITIRITGKQGTPITIDGAAAGKAPVSLKRRASSKTMTIGANGKTWKIVPDHDQTIDISK